MSRQTIDHRTDKVPLDDQCAEMIGIVAETEFDLQRRIGTGQISRAEAAERRRRRHAILATLKWLQEHRTTVIETHKTLTARAFTAQDLEDPDEEEDLTGDDS